jgi:tetratricopeptide (TPR) repeat protein
LAHARDLGDGNIELRLAVAIGPLRLRRGYLSEGRASLEHALSVSGDPTLRATALHQAGFIARMQRLDDEAEILLKEGLKLARELDDHPLTAKLLVTLAGLVSERDEAGAQILYDELLALVAQHPEERFSNAFINLADFAGRRGDFVSARDYSVLGVRLLREEGDSWGLAMALGNLGVALLQLGEKAEAEKHFVEALLLHEGIGDAFGTLALLSELGVAAIERDQIQRGIHLLAYVERVIEETEVSLFGGDAILHERAIARARSECRAFESEWSRGRSMTKEQAFVEALGDSAVRARSRASGDHASSRATFSP